ncbi:hypothetical protein ABIE52_006856 [Rhodococcus sp. OAS809]|uniref:hypothetical protein n=1 Tax=Rhodococcus sp. OAS809 TaxID=2663874 RepID=UPI00178ADA42
MSEHRRSVGGLQRVSNSGAATPVARPVTGDLSAMRAKNRVVTPVPPQQDEQPVTPGEPKPANKAVTVYISPEVYTQARLAFNATRTAESDRNWSHFVEKAVAGEMLRRAELHNGGEDFDGVDAPFSPGRPLSGS